MTALLSSDVAHRSPPLARIERVTTHDRAFIPHPGAQPVATAPRRLRHRGSQSSSVPVSMLAWEPRRKRWFDTAIMAVTAPVVIPLLGLCALAVRVDSPGPIFFTQSRTGRHGKRFELYKFRTMVANAEELKSQLQHLNELEPPDFKITNDPRITRVGKLLRATSLDELPQLWNVVKGEMSLVGPRPTSFSADTYRLWHTRRLEARPGLTGLWQVSGRHNVTFDDRTRLDDRYIRNWSLRSDLKIVARTIPALLRREGA
jgi:lipopolysaccharide/colanic/teichoic acid biosynthesis glycosyltransferase